MEKLDNSQYTMDRIRVHDMIKDFLVPKSNLPTSLSFFRELEDIELYFHHKNSIEEIFLSLEKNSTKSKWAKRVLEELKKASPLALKATFRLIQEGIDSSLSSCSNKEYRVANKLFKSKDFQEGVKNTYSRLNDYQTPKWTHKSVFDVKDELIDDIFHPLYFEFDRIPELVVADECFAEDRIDYVLKKDFNLTF
jgi:hypothetical protein